MKKSYEESVDKALQRITEHVPEDLVGKFAQESGITREDIHPIPSGRSGMVAAVDGSNTMVLEGGSVAIAAIRAVQTTFLDNKRHTRSITPLTLVTIGPATGTGTSTSSTRTVSASRPTRDWTTPIPNGHLPSSATHWSTGSPCRQSGPAGRSAAAPRRRTAGIEPEPRTGSRRDHYDGTGTQRSPGRHRKADPGNLGWRAPAPSCDRRTRGTPRDLRSVVGKGGRTPPRPHRVPPGKTRRGSTSPRSIRGSAGR